MREKVTLNFKKNWVVAVTRKGNTMFNTKRDFYTAIINAEVSEDLRDYARMLIEKMDATNAARKAKPTKAQLENAPLIDKIVEMLNDEPQTASDLAVPMDIKVQKASALLRLAVKEGRAASHDLKIKGKGSCKGYTRC